MGQKTSPILLRLGINTTWTSAWDNQLKISSTNHYSHGLHNDLLTREYINTIYNKFCIRPSILKNYKKDRNSLSNTAKNKGFTIKHVNKSFNTFKHWYIKQHLTYQRPIKKTQKFYKKTLEEKELLQGINFKQSLIINNGEQLSNKHNKKTLETFIALNKDNLSISFLSYKNTLSFYSYLSYIYQLHKNKYDSKLILYKIRKLYEIKKRLFFLNHQLNSFTQGFLQNAHNNLGDKLWENSLNDKQPVAYNKNEEIMANTWKITKRNYFYRFLLPHILTCLNVKRLSLKNNTVGSPILYDIKNEKILKNTYYKGIKKSLKKSFWIKRNFNLNYYLIQKNNIYIKNKLSKITLTSSSLDINSISYSLHSFNLFLKQTFLLFGMREERIKTITQEKKPTDLSFRKFSYYIYTLYLKLITLYLWQTLLTCSLFNGNKYLFYKVYLYNTTIKTITNPLFLKLNQFKLFKSFILNTNPFLYKKGLYVNNIIHKKTFNQPFIINQDSSLNEKPTNKIKQLTLLYRKNQISLDTNIYQGHTFSNFSDFSNIKLFFSHHIQNRKYDNYIKIVFYASLLKYFKIYQYLFSHFWNFSKNSFFFYDTKNFIPYLQENIYQKNLHKHRIESYHSEKYTIYPTFNDFLLSCQEYFLYNLQQNPKSFEIFNLDDLSTSQDKKTLSLKFSNIHSLQKNLVETLPTKTRLGNILLKKINKTALIQLNIQTAQWLQDENFHKKYNPFDSKRFLLKKNFEKKYSKRFPIKYTSFFYNSLRKKKTHWNSYKYYPLSFLNKTRLVYPANLFLNIKPTPNKNAEILSIYKKNIISFRSTFDNLRKKKFTKQSINNIQLPLKNHKILLTKSLLGNIIQTTTWQINQDKKNDKKNIYDKENINTKINTEIDIYQTLCKDVCHSYIFYKKTSKNFFKNQMKEKKKRFSYKKGSRIYSLKKYEKPQHYASPLLTFIGQLNRQNHILTRNTLQPFNFYEKNFNNTPIIYSFSGTLQNKYFGNNDNRWENNKNWESRIFINTIKKLWRINNLHLIIKRNHSKTFDTKILVENLSKYAIAFIKKNKGGKNKSQKLKNITSKIMTSILYSKDKKPNPLFLGGAFGFSGRVYGGKKAASFKIIYGNLPFNTLKAEINYANVVQTTKNGSWNFETWLNIKKKDSKNILIQLPYKQMHKENK